MTEFSALLDRHPSLIWIVGGAALLAYVLKQLAESSESVRKLLGPLGSRWKSKEERTAMVERLRSEKAALNRTDQDAINENLLKQVAFLRARLDDVEKRGRERDDYLVYDAEWHTRDEIHAAENNRGSSLPHMTLAEFSRKAEEWNA